MIETYAASSGLLRAVASYGHIYREAALGKYDTAALSSNAWLAIDFFLSRACFQGRRDAVSELVYNAVISALSRYLPPEGFQDAYRELSSQSWVPVKRALGDCIGRGKVGKARDAAMVVSSLQFIGGLPDLNIVKYAVREITGGRIDQLYSSLQAAKSPTGIVQVGPKVAAFYLRDVVSLYRLDDTVSPEFGFCLQPIDVWVRKVVGRLGLAPHSGDDHDLQVAIVDACRANGVSPLLFNQGAWYLGFNAFDILLELLAKQASAARSGSRPTTR